MQPPGVIFRSPSQVFRNIPVSQGHCSNKNVDACNFSQALADWAGRLDFILTKQALVVGGGRVSATYISIEVHCTCMAIPLFRALRGSDVDQIGKNRSLKTNPTHDLLTNGNLTK